MASYWPHAVLGAGVVLNCAGAAFSDPLLFATGANAVTISLAFLLQRRSNSKRGN